MGKSGNGALAIEILYVNSISPTKGSQDKDGKFIAVWGNYERTSAMINNFYVLTREKSKLSRNPTEFHFLSWTGSCYKGRKGFLGLGFIL